MSSRRESRRPSRQSRNTRQSRLADRNDGGRRSSRKPQFFRSQSVDAVLRVPSAARKYRKALYVFDFVLTGCGLTALILSALMMTRSGDTFIPDWIFIALLILGIITLFMGALGGRGATISYESIKHGEYNLWLISLTLLMGAMIILEIAGLVWVGVEYGAVQNDAVTDRSESLSNSFERSLKSKLEKQDEAWWDWQTQFTCCGYDNNTIPDSLATGKYCTTDKESSANACKDQLWDDVGEQALPIAAFIFFFLCLQIAVCVSSLCLSCIIKAQEPVYSFS